MGDRHPVPGASPCKRQWLWIGRQVEKIDCSESCKQRVWKGEAVGTKDKLCLFHSFAQASDIEKHELK